MNIILVIILIILLFGGIGTLPAWNHAQGWGWGPSGGLFTVLIVLLVLYLLGVFR